MMKAIMKQWLSLATPGLAGDLKLELEERYPSLAQAHASVAGRASNLVFIMLHRQIGGRAVGGRTAVYLETA